jgi:CRISPR/Cas system-associated exonuclease Cas4 (RecB family)
LQRHFLGLAIDEDIAGDRQLRKWWQVFQEKGPHIPGGRVFPELSLTVPIGRHLLTGRFDLLVFWEGRAQIYDWKTDAHPSTRSRLQESLQTRFYLALAAEGGSALEQTVEPEQISLSYWYVNAPDEMVTINYSQDRHIENWAYLEEAVAELDQLLASGKDWPLTDDLAQCRRCAYQVYCDRIVGSIDLKEWDLEDQGPSLEPARP